VRFAPKLPTYRRSAAKRRFGPKPGIASFNSIDDDDRLIVASLFCLEISVVVERPSGRTRIGSLV